jgi:hypothetical protein
LLLSTIFQLLLLLYDFPLDLCIFKLFLFLQFDKIVLQRIHESLNILVWSQLPAVANLLTTERAFFLPESVI